ncbi:MAG: hypothetical protein A3H96_00630 [Acidobacteria bacterium RIFCSPLOWO2_02_FULL_67_36]|nr:MAG: hypothetical protein A3H96_00630 [Acidobacteria bacterium RIFCSPLOWO2_02_FULL_67_36]OFW23080.1 MAG: hypothetical protein A3G21_00720 [Acidobacteria bacterium RIFCSPLOWO2_12_FULL_66_21]
MNLLILSPPSSDRADIVAALPSPFDRAAIVETAAQATSRVAQGGIELVLLDLAASDALRFLRRQASAEPRIPVICVADRRRPDASSEALRLGVVDVVGRPVRADDLTSAMGNVRELARIAERAPAAPDLGEATDGMFGTSPAMRDVLRIVRRVAHSRCGVLILGERGTGRGMVAHAIHAQGSHRDRPFVKIVCGDGDADGLGRLLDGDAAEGVTVYLEDLGELPPDMQARLEARVEQPSGARFIASAKPRLSDLVERGAVRRGLVESIGTVRIDLPPLRQRSQDVPLLATYFLKEACRRADIPSKTFSRSALTLLAALPWRGNAGELRSLTERLAVLVTRGVVLMEDVLANVRLDNAEAVGHSRGTLREARDRFEREYVTAVLQHHKGRMGAAARELGIERTNLYRKIKQLNIRWTVSE